MGRNVYITSQFFFQLKKEKEDRMDLVNELQQSIDKLTAENKAFSKQLEETTNNKEDGDNSSDSDAASKELQAKLVSLEKENSRKDKEIETLNEKVNYLRNLLVKMEKRFDDLFLLLFV